MIHNVLQAPALFASDVKLKAAGVLTSLEARLPHLPPVRQALYVSVIEAGLRTAEVRRALSRAAVAVARLPGGVEKLQSAVISLLRTIEASDDPGLRRDVWWALQDEEVASLSLDTPLNQQRVLYVLGPIANQVHAGGIEAAVERETLERWGQEATSRNLLDARERLKRFMRLPPPVSLKRKREDNPVEASVTAILRAKIPDLRIEGDLLDSFPGILDR